jgi:hypothetical protein
MTGERPLGCWLGAGRTGSGLACGRSVRRFGVAWAIHSAAVPAYAVTVRDRLLVDAQVGMDVAEPRPACRTHGMAVLPRVFRLARGRMPVAMDGSSFRDH